MNITVIGTGYVGLVTGTCFAEMGNNVTCVDINKEKINDLREGIMPIYEPGLESLVQDNVTANRLFFTSSLKDAMEKSNIFFIAVGTPEGPNGEANMEFVFSAAETIGLFLNKESIVINKSTVPVGTAHRVKEIILEKLKFRKINIKFHLVSNPEFLKEGDAIRDFMRPDRIVIGTESQYALDKLKTLYGPFNMNHDRIIFMGLKEAELTKYAANSMLAAKISFINEISHICDKLSIDIEDVRKGIGSDSRIGYSFIYPGAGYGGSCFPKDIKSIIQTAKNAGIEPLLLNAIDQRNKIQKNRLYHYILDKFGKDLDGKIFTIWGLAFKPGTDDMREAPSEVVISSIINNGGKIQAFDPVVNHLALKHFPKDWFHNNKIKLFDDQYSALENTDALILMTEWKMFRNPNIRNMKKIMKNPCIFDGRNQYDPAFMKQNGFFYKGIGR